MSILEFTRLGKKHSYVFVGDLVVFYLWIIDLTRVGAILCPHSRLSSDFECQPSKIRNSVSEVYSCTSRDVPCIKEDLAIVNVTPRGTEIMSICYQGLIRSEKGGTDCYLRKICCK